MIISFTGPSGSGKTSIAKALLEKAAGSRFLQSHTTRPGRGSDIPGEYNNVSPHEFERLRNRSEFAWTFEIHRHQYGTRHDDLDRAAAAKEFVFTILNVGGVVRMKEYLRARGFEDRLVPFYIDVEDENVLRERLTNRGDDEKEIARRMIENRSWRDERDRSGVRFVLINANQPFENVIKDVRSNLQEL